MGLIGERENEVSRAIQGRARCTNSSEKCLVLDGYIVIYRLLTEAFLESGARRISPPPLHVECAPYCAVEALFIGQGPVIGAHVPSRSSQHGGRTHGHAIGLQMI